MPTDPNGDAVAIVEQATAEEAEILRDIGDSPNDSAAVPLGRKDGLKRRTARSKGMTAEETQGER